MRRHLPLFATVLLLLAGCSTASTPPASSGAAPSGGPSAGAPGPSGGSACSGGLKGGEPGVVRITCDGPAEIKIQAGDVSRDMHGGRCQSAADVWSAAVGVVTNETGIGDKYTGPPVEVVAVNNTSTAGKATVQAVLGGKHYFDLGNATLTLAADGRTAHIEGTSDRASDAPGAKLVVDVTC
jgi:hypothetical protein